VERAASTVTLSHTAVPPVTIRELTSCGLAYDPAAPFNAVCISHEPACVPVPALDLFGAPYQSPIISPVSPYPCCIAQGDARDGSAGPRAAFRAAMLTPGSVSSDAAL
jgi:hypothetical protein